MAKRKSKKEVTIDDWISKRASSFRAGSLARAKVLGVDISSVPTPSQIREYLKQSLPLICYLSETPIHHSTAELDHKIPVSRDGSFSLDNVGITTRYYNNAKGKMTEEEFRELLSVISSWDDKGKDLLLRLISSNNIFKRKRYVRK